MAEIKIDPNAFKASKKVVEESLKEYRLYSKSFLNNARSQLEPLNSDFVSSIRNTLNNMTDTKAPNLVKALETYAKQLDAVADDFTLIDKTTADNLSSK